MATFVLSSSFMTAKIISVNDSTQFIELTPENDRVTSNIPSPYKWELKPIEGYRIDSATVDEGYDSMGNYNTQDFIVSDDGQYAYVESTTGTRLSNYDTSPYTPPTPKVVGFNHIYNPSSDELTSFSKERFYVLGEGGEIVDLGQFIINILELPFTLPSDVLGDIETIILGNKRIETTSMKVTTDLLEYDLGEITVPYKYNNGYDFVNTTILIHLPFCDVFEISSDYVIGETLGFKYRIDLYSGDLIVNVTSSKIGGVIHSESSKVGRNIPFIQRGVDSKIVGSQSSNLGVDNDNMKAIVEVMRNIPYELNNPFYESTSKISKLQNENGYVVVKNIELETLATLSEIDSIKNILSQGVLIK